MLSILKNQQYIFIRIPNWVGDAVMSLPYIKGLKEALTEQSFIGVGKSFTADIFRGSQVLSDFIHIPAKKTLAFCYQFRQDLQRFPNSAALLYTHSLSSAFEFFLAGVPIRAGYAKDGRKFLLTHSLNFAALPMQQQYADLNKLFGVTKPAVHYQLGLSVDDEAWLFADHIAQKHGITKTDKIIGLNPGAGYGSVKKWPLDYFVSLAKLIQKKEPQARFYVLGGPNEEKEADFICQGIGQASVNIARENAGLHNLKAIIAGLSILVTNDSGLRWYGLAMKIPTFVLFGGSDPNLTTCFMDNCYFLRQPPPCAPCSYRNCPADFACMRNLLPELVLQRIYAEKL